MKKFILSFGILATISSSTFADKYLGDLDKNPYNPNSVSNPYGRYGSEYSTDSINNKYGQYEMSIFQKVLITRMQRNRQR
jgi:hypothetical protein